MSDGPQYGRLERLRGNGRWITTRRFTARQLEREKIRYVHTRGGSPERDSFHFTVGVEEIDVLEVSQS